MRSQGVPEAVGASEDVIEADEERNELRVEVGPEQGATWIRAAAARDLSANPPSCLRVHVVSEQIADLGSDADVRRHWEGHPDERARRTHVPRLHALPAIDERDILMAAECQASGEPDARLSANWYRPADRKCHWKCQGNHTREGTPSVLALQIVRRVHCGAARRRGQRHDRRESGEAHEDQEIQGSLSAPGSNYFA